MLAQSQRRILVAFALFVAASMVGSASLHAQSTQSLLEIMARAYETSPALGAARAGQRATDENLPQAQSQLFRPQITINAQEGRTVLKQEEKDSNALGAIDVNKRTFYYTRIGRRNCKFWTG